MRSFRERIRLTGILHVVCSKRIAGGRWHSCCRTVWSNLQHRRVRYDLSGHMYIGTYHHTGHYSLGWPSIRIGYEKGTTLIDGC